MRRKHFMTPLLLILAISMVLLCASCGTTSFSSEQTKQMEDIVKTVMAKENIPGVIVGIWTPEGVWVKTFGKADISNGQAMSTSDKVRIASNTKTVVATVVLLLAQEGKLSLDDKLSKYVPMVKDADNITVRQNLQMTSGTFSFTEDEQFGKDFTADPLMNITPEQEIEIANKHDNYFPPGQGWHYSDTNYEIAGLIIEKVTGNKLADEVQSRVIKPLSLGKTSFPTTPDITGEHSMGYVLQNGKLVDYTRVNPAVPWGGGAMVSGLYDVKAWVTALVSGSLLDKGMHAEQMKTVGKGGLKYGLGVADFGSGFWGHNGSIFGFSSIMMRNPERDATFVVFANKSDNESSEADQIAFALLKVVYPEVGKK
ncbi:MAG: serine hydrolase domain-containing protein [Candidatus Geothermincolia bacterium]